MRCRQNGPNPRAATVLAGALGWLVVLSATPAPALETPTSSGPVAILDTPVLRVPQTRKAPTIDGVKEADEWEDASALTTFWYDRSMSKFLFLAPIQTQLQVYAAYDRQNLYLMYRSRVYPENSWLKARGRFPDVTHHPQYGLIWDDHVELEIRPYHDNVKGFRLGLLKWFLNPIGTVSDQHWSQQSGEGLRYQSKARVASRAGAKHWVIEIAIPLERLRYGAYAGKTPDGAPIVDLPPVPGTAYRVWFTRAIGGNGAFFNVFDAHAWNTTKTKLVLDPAAPSIQINELGPIMDDIIDVTVTLKNHNTRSETVRLGFFVESALGNVYSSYNDSELADGQIELVPGEVRKLRLRQKFPGISLNGNMLWFDVRAAGRPAKAMFLTRLTHFHHMEGGRYAVGEGAYRSFREARINVIAKMRPPRREFEFRYTYSYYKHRISAVVDRGIYGGSDEAKTATEARLTVLEAGGDERTVHEQTRPFHGDFACFLFDLPEDLPPGRYRVNLLLFDKYKRIVGEEGRQPFTVPKPGQYRWVKNALGLEDVVWEPFVPIEVAEGDRSFETLKHRFTLDETGLPKQICIKPDVRELPLEKRPDASTMSDEALRSIGRGPQLRRPIRLEAVVGGRRVAAKVLKPAKLVRRWKSELEYASKVRVGPIDADLTIQYDCDGAMRVRMDYTGRGGTIDAWELVADYAGWFGLAGSAMHGGGMSGLDRAECTLYPGRGVVWDSAEMERAALFYSHFVPWLVLASGDRAFTWIADSDEHWMLDPNGSAMTVERDARGEITWRAKFANHTQPVRRRGTIEFMILTHPSKPKPPAARRIAWFQQGDTWAGPWKWNWGQIGEDWPRKLLDQEGVRDLPEQAPLWWRRGYQLRGVTGRIPSLVDNALTGDLKGTTRQQADTVTKKLIVRGKEQEVTQKTGGGVCYMGRAWQDLFVWHFGLCAIKDSQAGWWWDETWPAPRANNVASGDAHFRDPKAVGKKELPYQSHYLTLHQRGFFKRLARVYRKGGKFNRQYFWANNAATCFESFGWDTCLVEGAASDHASFELDNVVVYPISQFRYNSHSFTGLVARVVPRTGNARSVYSRPGDDRRLDRQYFGRALLHDIGVRHRGPHGAIQQNAHAVRLMNALVAFGLFEADEQTQVLPYWRPDRPVHYGRDLSFAEAHTLRLEPFAQTEAKVHVTAFRRPLGAGGGGGCKVLIVIMNDNDEPIALPLRVSNASKLYGPGGSNTLSLSEVAGGIEPPQGASAALTETLKRWTDADGVVLRDVETGEFVRRRSAGDNAETYDPVHVRRHDYRVLYAHYVPEK
jgi:hypothetical protein